MENSCEICTAGSFCDGADHPETACPAGYFCPTGTKFGTQFPCPAGTRRLTTGATSVSDCDDCSTTAVGSYCPEGTGRDIPCPPGSACDDLQLDRYSDMCDRGYYSSAGGGCTICDDNHYCPPGTVIPLKCPAGTKGTGQGKWDRLLHCEPCAQGELCPRYG